ncbi:formylmethanofuran--tetrahydromethanopterin N-formyltransferase [Frigoriglobus tundricola]|uniref:Formylmethanofuran--tetrahydromethanopterin N-formyltransferase n=1 Tax=Frigoriglobus tundricola TaxID=2774151 RepID=A0A6M5YUQ1_9BACT|nr:formylmethanofuran--tetrahydromethanopterin N-formyltransferase [Frigoriglobus tundricola]QJW97164.1 Formylmethanofuran--tetrahydromethanopterin N-formyltransferase [Frigoriglobus tundricola]
MAATIDDTYAEAFRSIYASVLITARDPYWLDRAVNASTGNASSTILCDCEAGLDRYVPESETPDGRPGAIVQFHVPRFHKDRESRLERSVLVRVAQNVLTCPTATAFNVLDASGSWFASTQPPKPGGKWFPLGRKLAYFGDGHQFKADRFGRRCWVVPILSGEFVCERRCGFADGLMGGNLWFFGATADAALDAATRAAAAASEVPGVILPFPGGVASSGSKAGSKYKFSIASTYAEYCPTLRGKEGVASRLPQGVTSVQEIIINGADLPTIVKATQAAIAASKDVPDLLTISAGNYGGRLGKSFVYLHPEKQPA